MITCQGLKFFPVSNRLSMTNFWSALLLLISLAATSVVLTDMIFNFYKLIGTFTTLGDYFWHGIWISYHSFLLVWTFTNTNLLGQILKEVDDLKMQPCSTISWRFNYGFVYLLSSGLGLIDVVLEVFYVYPICESYSVHRCVLYIGGVAFLHGRYLLVESALGLLFWVVTTILTAALQDTIEDGIILVGKEEIFHLHSGEIISQTLDKLEEKISKLYEIISLTLDYFGWMLAFKCFYDVAATALSMFFFVELFFNGNGEAFNMFLLLSWRVTGLFAYASSADNFNEKVIS